MWSRGRVTIGKNVVEYEVKHYEKAFDFGIDGGRIAKLYCTSGGAVLMEYERGWNVKPASELARKAYALIVKAFA